MKRFWRVGTLALFCAVSTPILLFYALPVRAQGTIMNYESAEDATDAFIYLLSNAEVTFTEFEEMSVQPGSWDSISRKDLQKLKPEGVHSALEALAFLIRNSPWKVVGKADNGKNAADNGKTAIVEISPSSVSREVVCIREGVNWRVDLTATYANWTKLKPLEAERVLRETPEYKRRASCQSRMKQMALAMYSYAEDHGGRFPPAKNWADALKSYTRRDAEMFHCPLLKSGEFGYAMNWKLSGASPSAIKEQGTMVMFYESITLKSNHSGEGRDMAFRHSNGTNIAFVDGHIKWYKQDAEKKWPEVRFTFKPKK